MPSRRITAMTSATDRSCVRRRRFGPPAQAALGALPSGRAASLSEVRPTKPSRDSIPGAGPQPYNRTELRALREVLDERWPKLPPEDAERWLGRVRDGRSPYSRVRV